jgi:hypothetical protein
MTLDLEGGSVDDHEVLHAINTGSLSEPTNKEEIP